MHAVIDRRQCPDKHTLHQQLKEQRAFPDYYGYNLDALYDLLSIKQEATAHHSCIHLFFRSEETTRGDDILESERRSDHES